ncbi:MAG: aqualysin 1 [Cryptosporangiaceae bacterium]|nr:aqualysin 1 [Cryptosporangiaceae bacterium]
MRLRSLATALAATTAAVLAGALIPAGASADPQQPAAQGAQPLAPLVAASQGRVIAGEYLVVLKRRQGDSTLTARRHGGTVLREYRTALTGYAARLDAVALAAVRRDPQVKFVQPNARQAGSAGGTQANAPWHLDRIDQRAFPLDSTYHWASTGKGVTAYVIDSGVRGTHTEFGGRVKAGFSAIDDGNGTSDCATGTGHGTFVASEIGGKTYGVARQVSLVPVRVLDCTGNGSTEQIVAGMDWVAQHHTSPAVANISIESFQGAADPAMDQAAAGLISSGVITTLIAGNFDRGDCQNSPKDPRAIIAAASTISDARNTIWNNSSYGPCVTVFAPGAEITGAGVANDTAVANNWFGTSMAAPLVAGALAKVLQTRPTLTMAQAKQLVIDTSTKNTLTDVGTGSPNRLLYSAPTT